MNLLSDFGAQTCLIGEVSDLEFLDLDFNLFDSSLDTLNIQPQQQSVINSYENSIDKIQTHDLTVESQLVQANVDFSQLDFELTDLNLFNLNTPGDNSSQDMLFIDLLNSPSIERTYSNINDVTNTEDEMTSMSSPFSSISDESNFETKPKIRKTRERTIDKKESNKMAAIRYRNKKLKEKDQLFTECEEYAKKIKDMRQKVADTQAEISFIKSLLVEALVLKSGLRK
ncbi:unnamed protein product [Brachionus calyciflorus]|uniref:BZIP domain-containing protein n=1 Tax=Brachionus calyciflorus TaxID=104777 RepID=A0A814I9I7_9BILA|nr:unnamed protein product [Brachionus calyciflorus]